MRNNVILFAVFAALLGATYFFQEKRVEREHVEADLRDRLITEEISQLKLPAVEAIKKNGKWYAGDTLLSHNMFNQIEKKLRELKKVKDIQGEWKSYFPHPFLFEVNNEKWAIGDLSLDKQAFYISRGDKIYLAVVEGESTHLTTAEEEIEGIKLNELVSFLSRPLSELKENQLFRFYPSLPMDQALIATEGAINFELNFLLNQTLPPPIEGVYPHQDLRGKFFSLLTQVTLREEVPYSEKLKFKKLSEIKFLSQGKEVSWELWLVGKNSADAVIIDNALKKAWLMIGGTLKIFFVQVQDYWDKKVIPAPAFKTFSTLKTTFIQGEKEAQVVVFNKEPLEFKAKNYTVDPVRMDQLFQFIFNLGPKDQAERVSQLTSSERKQLLSETHLRIEVMNQDLLMWRKKEEFIVVNLTQGFKAHFNLLDENFHGTFEDVLK